MMRAAGSMRDPHLTHRDNLLCYNNKGGQYKSYLFLEQGSL